MDLYMPDNEDTAFSLESIALCANNAAEMAREAEGCYDTNGERAALFQAQAIDYLAQMFLYIIKANPEAVNMFNRALDRGQSFDQNNKENT